MASGRGQEDEPETLTQVSRSLPLRYTHTGPWNHVDLHCVCVHPPGCAGKREQRSLSCVILVKVGDFKSLDKFFYV